MLSFLKENSSFVLFLDYDEVMVKMVEALLREYNALINKWLIYIWENKKSLFPKFYANKNELLEDFLNFFTDKSPKRLREFGYKVYGDKIELFLKKDKKILNFFADKLFQSYKRHEKFNLKEEEVVSFDFFDKLPLGRNWFLKKDLYMAKDNPIKPYTDAVKFYKELIKDKDILQRTYILTATYPIHVESKNKHINRYFPLLSDKVIHTKHKGLITDRKCIFVDDSPENCLNSVKKYNFVFIRHQPYNKNFKHSQVVRCKDLNEFYKFNPRKKQCLKTTLSFS